MLERAERETRVQATGWEALVNRLLQVLFIYVLRASAEAERGSLAALADPGLRKVLEAVHEKPEDDWTLDRMARCAGVSRSVLVRRFRQVCGMSPMKYVTRWRMQRARTLLLRSASSAGEVSANVGYASEAAFNRVFKEHYGAPPGNYRNTWRKAANP